MISRLYLFGDRQQAGELPPPPGGQRAYLSGWLILALLTLAYLGWLAFRWLALPSWSLAPPRLLSEILDLIEMAAAVTLLLLWAGLLWRRYQSRASRHLAPLSLAQLYGLNPKAFEFYVASLFRKKGYRAIVRGRSGDHGVDLELFGGQGKRAIVQCKRYRDTVGEKTVRDLYGTLLHERAAHAFLVTTADISDAARKWADGKPMTLIDGPTLVDIAAAVAERPREVKSTR